jgi:hypothetical protein
MIANKKPTSSILQLQGINSMTASWAWKLDLPQLSFQMRIWLWPTPWQLCESLKQRTQLNEPWMLEHRIQKRVNVFCFKHLNLGPYCYADLENQCCVVIASHWLVVFFFKALQYSQWFCRESFIHILYRESWCLWMFSNFPSMIQLLREKRFLWFFCLLFW